MFADLDLASEVHEKLLKARGMLANSVASIKGRCSEEEYKAYRKMVGDALGAIIIDGLTPIEERHPSLKQNNPGTSS
jgi:hypothetical protein